MQRVLKDLTKLSFPYIQKNVVTTTLYELVEAINEEVQPEEKRLVPGITINILNTCRSNCCVQQANISFLGLGLGYRPLIREVNTPNYVFVMFDLS